MKREDSFSFCHKESKLKNNFWSKHKFFICIFIPIFALLLTLDLVSKHLINQHLEVGQTSSFLPGFLLFNNVHNEGAAWSIFEGQQVFLIVLTFVMLIVLSIFFIKEKNKTPLFNVAFSMFFAGSVGNLIDRLAFGYVRDLLQFDFWKEFPVFNVADSCICIGVGLVLLFFIISLVKDMKKKEGKNGKN